MILGMAFQAGDVVGEYTIVRVLGTGGLGAVYAAQHVISQRLEAMKVLLPEQTGTPEMQERFRREIQLLASLNHPHIAGLHNAFYFNGQLMMVMELVEGEDLRSYSRRARISLPVLIEYTAQVLSALEYAHARGVVHRDIKPANIMVAAGGGLAAGAHAAGSGVAKVLDFGIALTERSTELTAAGALIGSPTHMAPEQMRGEKATAQSDIYSLGVTLYELIAGQPPIQGKTTYELMMAHLYIVPIPLKHLRPEIPAALSDVVAKALEKEPAQRFRTAGEFLVALRQASQTAGNETATLVPASWQRVSTDELHRPPTGSMGGQTGGQTGAQAGLPVGEVVKQLAGFIGPIAAIVVARLAKQYTDLDRIYAEAAKQIEDEGERRRFLGMRGKTGNRE